MTYHEPVIEMRREPCFWTASAEYTGFSEESVTCYAMLQTLLYLFLLIRVGTLNTTAKIAQASDGTLMLTCDYCASSRLGRPGRRVFEHSA